MQVEPSGTPPPMLPAADALRIFESVPGCYLVLHPDLRIAAVSDAYLEATRTTRASIVGRGIFEVFPENPSTPAGGAEKLRRSLEIVMRDRKPHAMLVTQYDIPRPAAEGGGFEERYWSPINAPVLAADGTLLYLVHRVEDITAYVALQEKGDRLQEELFLRVAEIEESNRKLCEAIAECSRTEASLAAVNRELESANRELESANRELERSNRDLELFASLASHDLQTPIRNVATAVALLRRELTGQTLSANADRYLGALDAASSLMHRQVDGLLAFSRVSSGPAPVHVECSPVLQSVLQILSDAVRSCGARIEVGPLPAVRTNPAQLQLLLLNVIENALKYRIPERAPQVRVSGEVQGDTARLRVEDNGIGILPEQRERVFGMFKRLHTQREFPGAGIGLALCRKIAERHGGRIWTTGRADGADGSVFWIELPASCEGEP